jgi:hypothetical protein
MKRHGQKRSSIILEAGTDDNTLLLEINMDRK